MSMELNAGVCYLQNELNRLHMKLQTYSLSNYKTLSQTATLSAEQKEAIEVVGNILPFKTNNYVVNELINWDNPADDPMFKLTFPQKGMLSHNYFSKMWNTLVAFDNREVIKNTANSIRMELNPHPAGQMEYNVPEYNGEKIYGLQHKYKETVLFFPSQGQTAMPIAYFVFAGLN